mgnify:CR=1 FL=1
MFSSGPVEFANIDEVIELIRKAKDPAEARAGLMGKRWSVHDIKPLIELIDDPEYPVFDDNTYQMSEEQARAILELRLHRLTGLERDKIGGELKEITDRIAEYLEILGSRDKLLEVLVMELEEEFDINIPDDAAEKIQTIGEAVKHIEESVQSSSS